MDKDHLSDRIAVKCMKCGLHFNIHTWYPNKHTHETIHCPECGCHGDNAAFLIWPTSKEKDHIFNFVPGTITK